MGNNREYTKVIRYICSLIESGDLRMGERLPTERAISETLSISRNSTREALRTLEHMGAVECRQGSGNYLAENIARQISAMLKLMILMRQLTQEDICQFRRETEKAVCLSIMENGMADTFQAQAEEALCGVLAPAGRDEAELDMQFHYALIRATGNKVWICLMEAIMDIYREWIGEVMARANEPARVELRAEHAEILRALQCKDRTGCMQAIDRHYDRIEQEFHRTTTEKEQHMNRKLVIFDMDGTILDTLEDLKDALNHVLTQHSFPVRTLDEVRRFVGNGIYKLIERGVPAGTPRQEIDAVYEDFKPYYAAHCEDTTKAYDGIPALLRQLKAQGFSVAVVSNKADFAVQKLCEVYFPDTFDAALGEREGVRKKPAPDSVNEVLRQLQIPREQAVYVGDSDVDIETAKNANMPCLSVTWGFRDEAFLLEHGASHILHMPEEILQFVTQR